jgi:hypothetical protein
MVASQEWLKLARQATTTADGLNDTIKKETLLRIAELYIMLAEYDESQAKLTPSENSHTSPDFVRHQS